jgi:lipoyl(octanoyl) transferase
MACHARHRGVRQAVRTRRLRCARARRGKIAGSRATNGCTYHGLAVNIAMDLAPFADIDPCGYRGLAVAQLADLGVARTVAEAGAELAPILARRLSAEP